MPLACHLIQEGWSSKALSCFLQLENAAANVLARFHHVDEDGQEQDFTGLQVLLYSSKNFGPLSLRDLSVSPWPYCVFKNLLHTMKQLLQFALSPKRHLGLGFYIYKYICYPTCCPMASVHDVQDLESLSCCSQSMFLGSS